MEMKGYFWTSREVQVDLKVKTSEYAHAGGTNNWTFQFRYNFTKKRGEVKVGQEFRQRCSQLWRNGNTHPWQYPRLDDGQAGWIMRKLVNKIKGTFYKDERTSGHRPVDRGFTTSLEHHRDDCEACSLGRCPRNKVRADPNMRKGRERNNVDNLEHIVWVMLDENDHVYNL